MSKKVKIKGGTDYMIEIDEIFKKYEKKFLDKPKESRLTEYEKALGFTETTRLGSKQFANHFGYFMEEIYDLSYKFNKIRIGNKQKGGNDGENDKEYFECKNRYDTMKQSQAYNEIKPKLEQAIKENKEFKLLVLTDKNFNSKSIPLHNGFGLKEIQKIEGYNENKHRWISGDEIYKYLFDDYEWKKIKIKIITLLETIKSDIS